MSRRSFRCFVRGPLALSLCLLAAPSCGTDSNDADNETAAEGAGGQSAGGHGGSGAAGKGGAGQGGAGGGASTGGKGGATQASDAGAGSGGSGGKADGAGGEKDGSADLATDRAGPSDGGPAGDATAVAPKLSADVFPIVKMHCALSGCHDPITKEHGMDLSTAAKIFTLWVNKPTADHCNKNAAVTRVIPGKPDTSFVTVLIKATPGRCDDQARMPPAPLALLSANDIKTIVDWIAAGAKND